MSDTKALLWKNLQGFIERNVIPVVAKIKNEVGHEVLYLPPHYSDLQPIETVWAILKGDVGRQYKTETTFKDVLVRLKTVFKNLQSRTDQVFTRKANGKLRKLQEYIQHTKDIDEPDEDDLSDSNEINSSSEDTESDCDDNSS